MFINSTRPTGNISLSKKNRATSLHSGQLFFSSNAFKHTRGGKNARVEAASMAPSPRPISGHGPSTGPPAHPPYFLYWTPTDSREKKLGRTRHVRYSRRAGQTRLHRHDYEVLEDRPDALGLSTLMSLPARSPAAVDSLASDLGEHHRPLHLVPGALLLC
jgi:hypothetical protein